MRVVKKEWEMIKAPADSVKLLRNKIFKEQSDYIKEGRMDTKRMVRAVLYVVVLTSFILSGRNGWGEESLKLLTNNGNGSYVGVAVQKNGVLETVPWDKSIRKDYSEFCSPTGVTYTYPAGAPNYQEKPDQTTYVDPECKKLIDGERNVCIWRATTEEKIIEFDLKAEYYISKIVVHSLMWSEVYALNHIRFYLKKDDGKWERLPEEIEGYYAHAPYGGTEYYYYATGEIGKIARYVRVGLKNDENKLLVVSEVEIWGKEKK